VWRFLLQQRNQRGCTWEPLQFQRSPLEASRGWNQTKVNHEIAVESKGKDWKGKLTLGLFASLMECCSKLAFPLVRHGLGGFSSGEAGGEDMRWWKCMWVDLQSTKEAILLAVRVDWEWWLVGVH
jgi:hypothetical protein